jgi:methylated-DNA-[protein]-cysteine S-methyltransferase
MAAVEISSPIGPLTVYARAGRLTALRFAASGDIHGELTPELAAAATQLEEYFAAHRHSFGLPLELPDGAFNRRVLAEVDRIPHGERATYGDVTAALGLPGEDVRKVAAAIGRNPLPILIPCHRVVGADGRLVGYGGGMWRKRQLLTLEGGQLALAPSIAIGR